MTTEPTRHADPDREPRQAPGVDHDTLNQVRDRLESIAATTLYVVELQRWGRGDITGSLMTPWGETLYTHVSSSPEWLRRDLTESFGRATQLASRFGTYTVVHVGLDDEIPEAMAAYVRPAGEVDTDD